MPKARIQKVSIPLDPRDLHEFTRLVDLLAHEAEQAAREAEEGTSEQYRLSRRANTLRQLWTSLDDAVLKTLVQGSKAGAA